MMQIMSKYTAAVILILSFFIICSLCQDESTTKSNSVLGAIPSCVFGVKTISYYLYTRDMPLGKVVHMNDDDIPLHKNRNVVFCVHGFVAEANDTEFFNLTRALLQNSDINVFSVNWDQASCSSALSLTNYLVYGSAVKNVPAVGQDVAEFSMMLAKKYGVALNEIVLIGHSLGAHVVGFAGKYVQKKAKTTYAHILGLDPAAPAYLGQSCRHRLCKRDARFVTALHTSLLVGYRPAIGTDDFYFNGGINQPGCQNPSCDHTRAITYTIISINSPKCYLGVRWKLDSLFVPNSNQCTENTCSYVGLQTPEEPATGVFYVQITNDKPYCTA
ncbi:phospholipase A1-like [Calliopsis andreniformis]|uniref:phospholipase A1-like n=1 Tax=Calliopsis andreniformis TaxID=337506 RepID=UPI003FCD824B